MMYVIVVSMVFTLAIIYGYRYMKARNEFSKVCLNCTGLYYQYDKMKVQQLLNDLEFSLSKSRISKDPMEDFRIDCVRIVNEWRKIKMEIKKG